MDGRYTSASIMFQTHNVFVYIVAIITFLVAIYFSEASNISPVRVSNREIWHRHK